MNTKNRLIKKLLGVAKRHRVLTYPVLALVAVISVISNLFSWSTGAGKRVVAVVMVMVMLVSQSYFLTSSATEAIDDEHTALVQQELQQEVMNKKLESEVSSKSNDDNANEEKSTEVASDADSSNASEDIIDEDNMSGDVTADQAVEQDYAVEGADASTDASIVDNTGVDGTYPVSEEGIVDENAIEDEDLDSNLDPEQIKVEFYYQGDASDIVNFYDTQIPVVGSNVTYDITDAAAGALTELNSTDRTANGCYSFTTWFLSPSDNEKCSNYVDYKIENGNKVIKLYAKRNLVRYRVDIVKNDNGDDPASFNFGEEAINASDTSCYVAVVDNTATLTLKNISRHGYDPKAPEVSQGSANYNAESNTINISFSGDEISKTVTLGWVGKNYNITYAKSRKEGAETVVKSVQYGADSTDTILDMAGTAEDRDGWNYNCWTIGLGASATEISEGVKLATLSSAVQKSLFDNQNTTILYPDYTYAGIIATADSIEFQYLQDKNISKIVQGQYNKLGSKPGSTNFSYKINSGNDASIETEYGISIKADLSGILFSTGEEGPTKTTGSTPKVIKFQVTDNNGTPDDDSDDRVSEEFTINLTISQKAVSLSPIVDKSNIKPYDGNDKAKINDVLATDTNKVTVTYTSANYNSSNVYEATSIILTDPKIVVEGDDAAGTLAKNYILSSNSIKGEITKRPVWVKTKSKKESIRAGEDDPEFEIEEDKSKSNVYYGLLDGEDVDVLNVALDSNRPADKELPGNYKVMGTAGESNYEVNYTEPLGSFDVILESPESRYHFSAEPNESGWYVGSKDGDLTVIPNADSGYSEVRIYRSGSTDYDTSGKLNESDTTDNNLRIQLADPKSSDGTMGTNAVTSIKPLSIQFQHSAPVFKSYRIIAPDDTDYYNTESGVSPGLYFPGKGSVLDFGTYIRSTIKIELKYEDKTSKMNELEYSLFGSSIIKREKFNDDGETVVISIMKDSVANPDTAVGLIECVGVNKAGIRSASTILCPTKDNNKNYEWSIEEGKPQINPLIVYSDTDKETKRIVADQSGVPENQMAYYNNCMASLTVSDSVSGIESVTWYINDEEYGKEEIHDKKVVSDTYTKVIDGFDICRVKAIVKDNAGNEETTNTVTFKIDNVPPVIGSDYNDDTWTNNTIISFNASDALSGVNYIKVSDETGKTIDCDIEKPNTVTGIYEASFEAANKGKYSIVVADNAGNITTKELDVQKVSTEVPPCPTITIDPAEPNGENGWYNAAGKAPVATITNPGKSADDTPVITQYRLWKEGETGYNDTPIDKASVDVPINDEGVFNLKAWTKSVSGVECANYDKHVEVLKVDRTAPDISISTEKGNGSSVIVHFTVSDAVSGVNDDSIVVMHGDKNVDITKEATSTGIVGTFEITEKGNYTITAIDNAGNESDQAAFTPMTLKVKAVTNITDTGATLGANVIKGTFDIKSAAIAYRKASDNDYTEAETAYNVDKDTGNASASTVLTDLTPNTPYVFKVTAVSDANEVLEYEGYFKTLATDQSGIDVTGTAKYADDSKGNITVGLFEGNVCMMAEEITAGSEFTFYCVPDGNYSITATDGTYSKTTRLLIEDGMIIYPTQYIELVLSGQNTSVVITTDNTPNITADDMDSIFLNDKVNFTKKDSDLIDNGGTVEFKLYATLMTVSSVSADEISAMYAVTNKNKVVGAYLDLSLYKIVTDANGDVERSRVTNLANPAHISVTIPLGDLAGKPDLEVVRIHNDGENFLGASLPDNDSNPSTYTVVTDQFSTYAILYSIAGASTEAPTTAATEQPTTSSVVVQPTTSQVIQPTTSQVVPTTQYSYEDPEDEDDEDVKEIKDKTKKPKSSSATSVGTLTSSGSAKTGDETPIVLMFALMMISCGAVVVLRKKYKDVE